MNRTAVGEPNAGVLAQPSADDDTGQRHDARKQEDLSLRCRQVQERAAYAISRAKMAVDNAEDRLERAEIVRRRARRTLDRLIAAKLEQSSALASCEDTP
jgi:hypothetical protein